MALNNDFNLRRLDRYLSIAWDSEATPVVVLTKSDLCDDLQ
ncbi:GTPase RsgA [Bacillus sp. FJAT-28004]|nr:GTPase RsgA [Bacillus sp. FJAT-28004]